MQLPFHPWSAATAEKGNKEQKNRKDQKPGEHLPENMGEGHSPEPTAS